MNIAYLKAAPNKAELFLVSYLIVNSLAILAAPYLADAIRGGVVHESLSVSDRQAVTAAATKGNAYDLVAKPSFQVGPDDGVGSTHITTQSSDPRTVYKSGAAIPKNAGTTADTFIRLDYSLPPGAGASDGSESPSDRSIKVRKAVFNGSNSIGSIDITIDDNAQIFLDSKDVRTLLSANQGSHARLANLPSSGPVSFRALRDLGIDFRYDPNEDMIALKGAIKADAAD